MLVDHSTHLICKALVPSTLALSYLVMYGVVTLISFGFAAFPARCFPSPAGALLSYAPASA